MPSKHVNPYPVPAKSAGRFSDRHRYLERHRTPGPVLGLKVVVEPDTTVFDLLRGMAEAWWEKKGLGPTAASAAIRVCNVCRMTSL